MSEQGLLQQCGCLNTAGSAGGGSTVDLFQVELNNRAGSIYLSEIFQKEPQDLELPVCLTGKS